MVQPPNRKPEARCGPRRAPRLSPELASGWPPGDPWRAPGGPPEGSRRDLGGPPEARRRQTFGHTCVNVLRRQTYAYGDLVIITLVLIPRTHSYFQDLHSFCSRWDFNLYSYGNAQRISRGNNHIRRRRKIIYSPLAFAFYFLRAPWSKLYPRSIRPNQTSVIAIAYLSRTQCVTTMAPDRVSSTALPGRGNINRQIAQPQPKCQMWCAAYVQDPQPNVRSPWIRSY